MELKDSIKRRITRLSTYVRSKNLDGYLIFDPYNIFYMIDFFHVPTERPVAVFINRTGETHVFVPSLEEKEAKHNSFIDCIETYFEYPGKIDVFDWMSEILVKKHKISKILVDTMTSRKFSKIKKNINSITVDGEIYKMRLIKDNVEIDFLKCSGYYSDYIVGYGFNIIKPGMTELELLSEMKAATTKKMIEDMDEIIFVPGGPVGGLVPSGINTVHPHALPSAKVIQKGDTQILSCGANVHGYSTECERTGFIGGISLEKIKAFNVMKRAQEIAIELMVPGNKCSEIDKTVLQFIRDKGYGDFIRHRTGHGKGLQKHEAPWVEAGDETVLEPGMVLSSEPGIYIDNLSGFRHSDTIIVTKDEPLVLTNYSKKLEELIITF